MDIEGVAGQPEDEEVGTVSPHAGNLDRTRKLAPSRETTVFYSHNTLTAAMFFERLKSRCTSKALQTRSKMKRFGQLRHTIYARENADRMCILKSFPLEMSSVSYTRTRDEMLVLFTTLCSPPKRSSHNTFRVGGCFA